MAHDIIYILKNLNHIKTKYEKFFKPCIEQKKQGILISHYINAVGYNYTKFQKNYPELKLGTYLEADQAENENLTGNKMSRSRTREEFDEKKVQFIFTYVEMFKNDVYLNNVVGRENVKIAVEISTKDFYKYHNIIRILKKTHYKNKSLVIFTTDDKEHIKEKWMNDSNNYLGLNNPQIFTEENAMPSTSTGTTENLNEDECEVIEVKNFDEYIKKIEENARELCKLKNDINKISKQKFKLNRQKKLKKILKELIMKMESEDTLSSSDEESESSANHELNSD